MRWHGVDPASINLMGGLSAEEMLGRFRNGDADYLASSISHLPGS